MDYVSGRELEMDEVCERRFLSAHRQTLTEDELRAFRSVKADKSENQRFKPASWRVAEANAVRPGRFEAFRAALTALDNAQWSPDWCSKQRHQLAHKFGSLMTFEEVEKLLLCPQRPSQAEARRLGRQVNPKTPYL
eukprot:Skav232159  [mRNA]  locus=scaffold1040:486610:487017:- [translate_table: standard]